MSNHKSKRISCGRRNDEQSFYCTVCNVSVINIARHERTKKHKANLQLINGSEQNRQPNNEQDRSNGNNELHTTSMECDQPTDIESVDENQTNNDFESNSKTLFALETSHDNFDDDEVKDEDGNEKEKN